MYGDEHALAGRAHKKCVPSRSCCSVVSLDSQLNGTAVTRGTRASAIAADGLVLVLTWLKTWRLAREARRLHMEVSYTTLLLRDGTSPERGRRRSISDQRYVCRYDILLVSHIIPDSGLPEKAQDVESVLLSVNVAQIVVSDYAVRLCISACHQRSTISHLFNTGRVIYIAYSQLVRVPSFLPISCLHISTLIADPPARR